MFADILLLLAIGAMLPLITSFPVSLNNTWTDPCLELGDTPPDTVSMLGMMESLTEDAQNLYKRAEELMKFYTTVQKDESQPRVTPSYVNYLEKEKFANFPADNEYNSDNLTLVLLNHYKQMSRVAIFCQDAIQIEKTYSHTTNAQGHLDRLTNVLTSMLCHLDLALKTTGYMVSTFEDSNELLDDDAKTLRNKDHHDLYEYIIFKETYKFASALLAKYSNITKGMGSDKKE
ncbi:uncharacterized protein LOC112563905 [Pomacea canaliculata]|uniref:uncharacterized protein LOC112563905 n=1 Tax=Pomacea canaliculata TaxID=400727 RepID=UPI000D73DA4B|nr:uncharacterized protein LOC112563905 [Pomacea canaliculata]